MEDEITQSNNTGSVGSLLKGARLERELSIAEVAKIVKIPAHFITAFEADDHWRLPENAYTRLYLRAYAEYLGFNASTLINLFNKERGRTVDTKLARGFDAMPKRELGADATMVMPRVIQGVFIAILALAITGYFGYEFKRMLAPPFIDISEPADGFITDNRTVVLKGNTEKEVTVRVNGKDISPDDNGYFEDTLVLQEGLNTISITASKKRSKETTVTRRIIVNPPEVAETAPGENAEEETVTGEAASETTTTEIGTKPVAGEQVTETNAPAESGIETAPANR